MHFNLPNALADLALQSLADLSKINSHRLNLAQYYFSKINNPEVKVIYSQNNSNSNIYLRFVILAKNRQALWRYFRNHKIILGNWYDRVISPKNVDLAKAGYALGDCPKAELAASQTLNLPNHLAISLNDADKVIKLLNEYHGD